MSTESKKDSKQNATSADTIVVSTYWDVRREKSVKVWSRQTAKYCHFSLN